MPDGVLTSILESLNREVLNQLDLAKAIRHPGESGRAREQIIAAYLRRVIPADFGISTGFVVDAAGSISRQLDIVIYRTNHHPVLEVGGVKHFMVESVLAVLENKASMASSEKLRQAYENIASVKRLDRSNAGTNYLIDPGRVRVEVDRDDFQHQIFGAVVTEESLTRESLIKTFAEFVAQNPNRQVWPNIYADVRSCAVTYLREREPVAFATVDPYLARFIAVSDPSKPPFAAPLLELTFELVNFLRIAPVIDYKPTGYFPAFGGSYHWWTIKEEHKAAALPEAGTPSEPASE